MGISHISEIKQYEIYWHRIKKRLTIPIFQARANQVRSFILGVQFSALFHHYIKIKY